MSSRVVGDDPSAPSISLWPRTGMVCARDPESGRTRGFLSRGVAREGRRRRQERRCGLAWLRGARRVRTGNVYVRDPLSCVHRECICVHSRVPFAMCVAQGARVWVDPGGGSSAPSRWRTAGCCCQRTAQHREVPGCAHSGRKAPGNDRTLCPRVPGNDQTLCLRGGRAARLLYASLPTRATHEDSLRDSRRGARLLGGSPKLGCWCLLWRAVFPLPTWS